MLAYCTSLTKTPDSPATKLQMMKCYSNMFDGCWKLNSIKIGYTGNYDSLYFREWVSGVANSGTFQYNGSDTLASFGFPEGWTVQPFNQ